MDNIVAAGVAAVAGVFAPPPDPKPIFDAVRPWLDRRGYTPDRIAALNAAIAARAGGTLDTTLIFETIRPWLDAAGYTSIRIAGLNRAVREAAGAPYPAAALAAPDADATKHYVGLIVHVAQRPSDGNILTVARAFAEHAPRYGQDSTPARIADFFAQTCNETGGYRRFEENLRYSARRLMQVWPRRFPTLASALPYAWDPSDPDREDIALANRTYGHRMGNERDGTDDNDGWDYRGLGALQLTGYDNFVRYGELLGLPLAEQPQLAADPAVSVLIALEFYKQGKVNRYIDAGNTKAARGITNAGDPNFANPHGLAEVNRLRARALEFLR